MKAYLHIGTEKTGSTTIQDFINNNHKILQEQVYIPHSLGYNHWPLAVLAYDDNKIDSFKITNNLLDKEEFNKYKTTLFNNLKLELEGKTNILFTSELIHSRLNTKEEIQKLKKILIQLGINKFKIIVYLREQGDLINSLFSEAIKWSEINEDFDFTLKDNYKLEYEEGYKKNITHFQFICDHKNTIQNWQDVFGQENIAATIFDKKYFKDNDLITDFLDKINIKNNNAFIKNKNSNKSLDIYGVDLLLYINKQIPLFTNFKQNHLRGDILKFINKYFTNKNHSYKLSNQIINNVREYYKKDNEYLENIYFNNNQKFIYKNITSTENKTLDTNIKECIFDIISSKNKVILDLKKDIKWLKNYKQNNLMNDIDLIIDSTKAYKLGKYMKDLKNNKLNIIAILKFIFCFIFYKEQKITIKLIKEISQDNLKLSTKYKDYIQGMKIIKKQGQNL
ncbi:hypothetical protein [Campylobacter sp. 2018MI10]|uniref:hypothetical protein n=2 Tax=unclassified Campylobacter TaxID=2593542 RepID=UPI001BD9AB2F|nr:hypothetical protein [Campylobacter sp. 2018MI10]MBT0885141.1 hypothetical protein [Campylobacter sp. 2018MI10]